MSTSYAWSQDRLARETVRLPLQAQALFALEWPALQRLDLQSSSRIADLGCGDGTWMSLLQEQCPSALTMGIDPGEAVVRIARERHRGLNFACSTEPGSGLTVLEEFEPDLVTMRFVHQHFCRKRNPIASSVSCASSEVAHALSSSTWTTVPSTSSPTVPQFSDYFRLAASDSESPEVTGRLEGKWRSVFATRASKAFSRNDLGFTPASSAWRAGGVLFLRCSFPVGLTQTRKMRMKRAPGPRQRRTQVSKLCSPTGGD